MNKYQYTVNGHEYIVEIEEIIGNKAHVNVNGRPFEVETKNTLKSFNHKPIHIESPKTEIHNQAPTTPQAPTQKPMGKGDKVLSPLPGTITDIIVKVGDQVKTGDTVVILEAMKMQNSIEADTNGTISSILVKEGETVMEGAVLVTIQNS